MMGILRYWSTWGIWPSDAVLCDGSSSIDDEKRDQKIGGAWDLGTFS